jgi:predicted HAD superfamily Cof-like phosphohydrolase
MGFPLGEPTNTAAVQLQADLIDEEHEEFKWATDNENELKELADLVFVCFQYAALMGWDLDEALDRVFDSNMSKTDNDGNPIKNAAGKLMKGPNYVPPDLSDLI